MTNYFKTPFKVNDNYIFDKDGNMCFTDFNNTLSFEEISNICYKLNGESIALDKKFHLIDDESIALKDSDEPLLTVRSWGRLTGTLKLSDDEAISIQTEFIKKCIEILNK